MKKILFTLLCMPLLAFTQTDKPASEPSAVKGATPIPTQNAKANTQNSTYAVVAGISDYQDKDIPDLRFAHKDAEAFAL